MNTTTSALRQVPQPSGTYLAVLTWLFTLFNSVRVLAYHRPCWPSSAAATAASIHC